ncbi:hypothetical protein HDV63DRAFT_182968 [Trichoderma sp. SZMC 28014]
MPVLCTKPLANNNFVTASTIHINLLVITLPESSIVDIVHGNGKLPPLLYHWSVLAARKSTISPTRSLSIPTTRFMYPAINSSAFALCLSLGTDSHTKEGLGETTVCTCTPGVHLHTRLRHLQAPRCSNLPAQHASRMANAARWCCTSQRPSSIEKGSWSDRLASSPRTTRRLSDVSTLTRLIWQHYAACTDPLARAAFPRLGLRLGSINQRSSGSALLGRRKIVHPTRI